MYISVWYVVIAAAAATAEMFEKCESKKKTRITRKQHKKNKGAYAYDFTSVLIYVAGAFYFHTTPSSNTQRVNTLCDFIEFLILLFCSHILYAHIFSFDFSFSITIV